MEEFKLVSTRPHRSKTQRTPFLVIVGGLILPAALLGGWLYLRSLPPADRQAVVAAVEKQTEAVLGIHPAAPESQPAASPDKTTDSPPKASQTPPASPQKPSVANNEVSVQPATLVSQESGENATVRHAPSTLGVDVKRLPIVRLDLDRKESVAQRVPLDLPELTSEERESLRLDLKLSGVDSEYAEGAAGLTGRQPSVFRIDGKVPFEVEIRLGRDGEKNILLVKSFALMKSDGKREKRVPMSLSYARSLLTKAQKRHEAAEKVVYNLNTRLNQIKREDEQVDKKMDELGAQLAVEQARYGLSPQLTARFQAAVKPVSNSKALLRSEKATIEARLPTALAEVQAHLSDMKHYEGIAKDLEAVEKYGSLNFRAFALKDGELKPIAESVPDVR